MRQRNERTACKRDGRSSKCRRALALAGWLTYAASTALAQTPGTLPTTPPPLAAVTSNTTQAPLAAPSLPPPPAGQLTPVATSIAPPAYGVAAPGCSSCGVPSCEKGEDAWEFYVRFGIVSPIGRGNLDEHVDTGWNITVGLKEPLNCPSDNWKLFADLGVGYTQMQGDQRPVITAGSFQAFIPFDQNKQILPDFNSTQLDNLQRTHIQGGLDAQFYPAMLNDREGRRIFVSLNSGGRVAKVRAEFQNAPTPGLIQAAFNSMQTGHNPAGFDYISFTKNVDYSFGLFVSPGVGMTFQDTSLGSWRTGDISIGAQLEYGYDWFTLGDYDKKDQGMATLVPSVSVAFSF